ncbi:hypothetical protein AOLI_G00113580 [Acnodon oligacanthus]
MLLCVFLIFTQFEGNTAADGIYPLSSEKHALEGADVIFSCNYSAASVQGLQWYRQYPRSRPEFLLFLTEVGGGSDPALRLTAEADRHMKRMDLNISHTVVSDSALYYCALVPTVTGNSTTPYKNSLQSQTEHSKDLFLTRWSSYVLIAVESKGFYSKTEVAL